MKKKLLLFIPALLALSACGGANPKVAEPATFLEDTAAHTELFGKVEEAKPVRRNAETITEPSIGYQLKFTSDAEDGKLAIRFYALINELDADIVATWSRGVAGADGTDLETGKGFDDVLDPTTKYYTYLEGVGNAPEGKGYVVYSLYNIPYTDTNRNAYVAAYLTLTDTASHEAKSKVLAVKIDCGDETHTTSENYFSFNHQSSVGRHFLQGTFNGGNPDVKYATTEGGDNFAEYTNVALKTTDSFGSFYYNSNIFQYFGNSTFFDTSREFFREDLSNLGYSYPVSNGSYTLFVSSGYQNHIYTSRTQTFYNISLAGFTEANNNKRIMIRAWGGHQGETI